MAGKMAPILALSLLLAMQIGDVQATHSPLTGDVAPDVMNRIESVTASPRLPCSLAADDGIESCLSDETSLLQKTNQFKRRAGIQADQAAGQGQHSPIIDASFDGKLPIEWVHVPKTGTSFLNTLVHIPGVCPGLPTDFVVNDLNLAWADNVGIFQYALGEKMQGLVPYCNPSYLDLARQRMGHYGIEGIPGFEAGKGHFMMFMRQPEQKIMSLLRYDAKAPMVSAWFDLSNITEFCARRAGEVTKMLARAGEITLMHPRPPTTAEVNEAKFRLQTGFSFIGITEKWDLSICLFNKMFNQACQSLQFKNSHATSNASTLYDTAALKGWRDPYDNELYDMGLKIFETNLNRYNVSESSCVPCWREAGLLSASR